MPDKKGSFDDSIEAGVRKYKGRPNAAKRAGARDIVRALQWLSHLLVYWAGTTPDISARKDDLFRPIRHLIGKKLEESPTGIYAIEAVSSLAQTSGSVSEDQNEHLINPRIICTRVTEALIAQSSRALQAAGKYPRALPKMIPDAKEWLDRQSDTLRGRAAALRAASKIRGVQPDILAVEETCLWLGPNDARPSQLIQTSEIISWLKEDPDIQVPGKRAAAVVLGGLKAHLILPDKLKIWHSRGVSLSNWPVDVILRLPDQVEFTSPGDEIFKGLNQPHIPEVLWEWLVQGLRLEKDDLQSLSALTRACEKLESEPARRRQALRHSLSRTIREIREIVDEESFLSLTSGDEWETRLNVFADSFIQHHRTFIDKQGLSIAWNEWSRLKFLDFAYLYSLEGFFPSPIFRLRNWTLILQGFENSMTDWDEQTPPNTGWKTVLTGLALRAAGRNGRKTGLRDITRWVDICRIHSLLWDPDQGLSPLTINSLESGMIFSLGDKSNLNRLLSILAELGHRMLGDDLLALVGRQVELDLRLPQEMAKSLTARLKVISRFGTLTPEQSRFVITDNLTDIAATALMKGNPDALKDFIPWLMNQEKGWFQLFIYHKKIWARLFRLDNTTLVTGLLRWLGQDPSKSRLNWAQKSEVLDSVLNFCVCESRREDDPYEPDDYPDEKQRQRFIQDNTWLLDQMVESVVSVVENERMEEPENAFSDAWHRRRPILDYVYFQHGRQAGNERRFAAALLKYCRTKETTSCEGEEESCYRDILTENNAIQRLTVMLSGGDIPRFLNMLSLRPRNFENPERLLLGWDYAEHHADIVTFIISQSRKRNALPGIFSLLDRLATIRLLPEKNDLERFLQDWRNPPVHKTEAFPSSLPDSILHLWRQYVGYGKLAGRKKIDENIQKILALPSSMQNEFKILTGKQKTGQLDDSSRMRLNKLLRYVENPDEMEAMVGDKLSRFLNRQVPRLKMKALDEGIIQVIHGHWKSIIKGKDIPADDPDWDNTLWLYLSISKNKRLLRRLLEHRDDSSRLWIEEHPENRKVLTDLQQTGVDTDALLKGFSKTWMVDGQNWKGNTENDPLKIFHMGNLFGTCLRVGGTYDYSVVSNAVEVNKRVLYLKNERGTVIGRKLLLLRRDGTLFGCHSYGACNSYDFEDGGSPWVKICFDLFCRELAERCRLKMPAHDDYATREDFLLFSSWYFDGTEAIDWWVTDLLDSSFLSDTKPESLLGKLYRHIHHRLVHDRYLDEDFYRLLIWLGDDLLPVLDKVLCSPLFKKKDLAYLSRFMQGSEVKKKIKEYA
ncbi:MAG: hypothetical protein MUP70_09270 [Candidatus Aminicenantes bacterium]|nr:hypothetical protein [Candidatus Aminicenantes bacterium]